MESVRQVRGLTRTAIRDIIVVVISDKNKIVKIEFHREGRCQTNESEVFTSDGTIKTPV